MITKFLKAANKFSLLKTNRAFFARDRVDKGETGLDNETDTTKKDPFEDKEPKAAEGEETGELGNNRPRYQNRNYNQRGNYNRDGGYNREGGYNRDGGYNREGGFRRYNQDGYRRREYGAQEEGEGQERRDFQRRGNDYNSYNRGYGQNNRGYGQGDRGYGDRDRRYNNQGDRSNYVQRRQDGEVQEGEVKPRSREFYQRREGGIQNEQGENIGYARYERRVRVTTYSEEDNDDKTENKTAFGEAADKTGVKKDDKTGQHKNEKDSKWSQKDAKKEDKDAKKDNKEDKKHKSATDKTEEHL